MAESEPTWGDVAAQFPTWGDLAAQVPNWGALAEQVRALVATAVEPKTWSALSDQLNMVASGFDAERLVAVLDEFDQARRVAVDPATLAALRDQFSTPVDQAVRARAAEAASTLAAEVVPVVVEAGGGVTLDDLLAEMERGNALLADLAAGKVVTPERAMAFIALVFVLCTALGLFPLGRSDSSDVPLPRTSTPVVAAPAAGAPSTPSTPADADRALRQER